MFQEFVILCIVVKLYICKVDIKKRRKKSESKRKIMTQDSYLWKILVYKIKSKRYSKLI